MKNFIVMSVSHRLKYVNFDLAKQRKESHLRWRSSSNAGKNFPPRKQPRNVGRLSTNYCFQRMKPSLARVSLSITRASTVKRQLRCPAPTFSRSSVYWQDREDSKRRTPLLIPKQILSCLNANISCRTTTKIWQSSRNTLNLSCLVS